MRAGGGEQNALQPRDRLRPGGIEVGQVIVALFKRSLVFVTNAQVESQGAGYFPIVLQIPVVAGLEQSKRRSDGERSSVRNAQQQAC